MDVKDLLKLQSDLTRKKMILETVLNLVRSPSVNLHEKTALKIAVKELEKSIKQLETALKNNLNA